MKKRLFAVLFCLQLLLAAAAPITAYAAEPRSTMLERNLATDLKALRLFQGVSENNFDLERPPTRVEAVVMLIRFLGKEEEALSGCYRHPFVDVPSWADDYIGYAYQTCLTNGSSETEFGIGAADASMYLTFMLRALGYSDNDGLDFTWTDPFPLASAVRILPAYVDLENFWRADAVLVSYAALNAYVKDSPVCLSDNLIEAGIFTQSEYEEIYDFDILKFQDYKPGPQQRLRPGYESDWEYVGKHYEWEYGGMTWRWDPELPLNLIRWYKSMPRGGNSEYDKYEICVADERDDKWMENLSESIQMSAVKQGWGDYRAIELAIRFVQSLEYQPDDDGLGWEYPKYPLETIYDYGGDCEDTSILLVSLIKGMGYESCLVEWEEHMGVGISLGEGTGGTYFEHDGRRYYYVETTGDGWEIGELPDKYHGEKAEIHPF